MCDRSREFCSFFFIHFPGDIHEVINANFHCFFFNIYELISYSTQTSSFANTPEMNFLGKLPCVAKTPVQKYCLVIDLELFKVLYLRSYELDL